MTQLKNWLAILCLLFHAGLLYAASGPVMFFNQTTGRYTQAGATADQDGLVAVEHLGLSNTATEPSTSTGTNFLYAPGGTLTLKLSDGTVQPLSIIKLVSVTLAGGEVEVSEIPQALVVDTEGLAASDTLETFTGPAYWPPNTVANFTIQITNNSRAVTISSTAGNFIMHGDCVLDSTNERFYGQWDGTSVFGIHCTSKDSFVNDLDTAVDVVAGVPTFTTGVNIAAGQDLNLADNSRIMLGASNDGLIVDEATARLNQVAGGTEVTAYYWDLDAAAAEFGTMTAGNLVATNVRATNHTDLAGTGDPTFTYGLTVASGQAINLAGGTGYLSFADAPTATWGSGGLAMSSGKWFGSDSFRDRLGTGAPTFTYGLNIAPGMPINLGVNAGIYTSTGPGLKENSGAFAMVSSAASTFYSYGISPNDSTSSIRSPTLRGNTIYNAGSLSAPNFTYGLVVADTYGVVTDYVQALDSGGLLFKDNSAADRMGIGSENFSYVPMRFEKQAYFKSTTVGANVAGYFQIYAADYDADTDIDAILRTYSGTDYLLGEDLTVP